MTKGIDLGTVMSASNQRIVDIKCPFYEQFLQLFENFRQITHGKVRCLMLAMNSWPPGASYPRKNITLSFSTLEKLPTQNSMIQR